MFDLCNDELKIFDLSAKNMNKIIGKVDKCFTWHNRHINAGKDAHFFNHDTFDYISVKRTPIGVWCYFSVTRNGSEIKKGMYCKSFKDVKNFLAIVQVIG